MWVFWLTTPEPAKIEVVIDNEGGGDGGGTQ